MAAHHNIHKIIEGIKSFWENHKSLVDYVIGGNIGFWTGVNHYWDHFTEEDIFRFIDGSLGVIWHTALGAFVLWALHRWVFKTKKKNENPS